MEKAKNPNKGDEKKKTCDGYDEALRKLLVCSFAESK
jgi:hypothetical protein